VPPRALLGCPLAAAFRSHQTSMPTRGFQGLRSRRGKFGLFDGDARNASSATGPGADARRQRWARRPHTTDTPTTAAGGSPASGMALRTTSG